MEFGKHLAGWKEASFSIQLLTCLSEISSFSPSKLGFDAVITMRIVFVGEQHDPLVAHLKADFAEEIGANPKCFTQWVVSTMAKWLSEECSSLLSFVFA